MDVVTMNLLKTKQGIVYRVLDIDETKISESLFNKLKLFGIRKGRLFRVVCVNKTGCIINIQSNQVALGKGIAEQITVQVV